MAGSATGLFLRESPVTDEQVTVSVSRTARVQPKALFELLDDATGWPRWSAIGSVSFERPEDEAAQIVGAQRVFTTALLRLREQIIVRVPDCRIEYALLSGLPLDEYVGRIELKPLSIGTKLTWSATFRVRRVGTRWFWKLAIGMIIASASRDAIRAAETKSSSRKP